MVNAPAVVTLPYQISSSDPEPPPRALVQVVTPTPDSDDTVGAPVSRIDTVIMSPTVLGLTESVMSPVPEALWRVPTAEIVPLVPPPP